MHYLALVITDKPLNDKTNILLVSTAVIMISCKRLQTSHYTRITFSLFFNGNTSFFDIQEAILGLFN
ncbi:unnamed protein product [Thelazia callipaeda]|uniref:Cyclin N-terminal domain-containing protein n=1 Tax=Thelazia callipaeda TaxID=103827 RepID=A0A0N5CU91_THECL|nr:unnamed protein product [Thelazia callipaeda]